jgi:hypothetical protein
VVLVACRNSSLVDPLDFTSWLTSTPVSLAPPYEQRKATSWRTSPSFACSPASGRPSSPQFPPLWQQSVPPFTPADDQPRFLLHFQDDNSCTQTPGSQSCGHTSHVKRTSSRSTVAKCSRSYASTTTSGQMGTGWVSGQKSRAHPKGRVRIHRRLSRANDGTRA